MMMQNSKQLITYVPLGDNIFWRTDEASGDQVLVPNFYLSWAENATWVDWLTRFVRKNLPNFASTFKPADLDNKTNVEIVDRIQAAFANFQKRVKELLGTNRMAKLAKNKQFQRKKRVRTLYS